MCFGCLFGGFYYVADLCGCDLWCLLGDCQYYDLGFSWWVLSGALLRDGCWLVVLVPWLLLVGCGWLFLFAVCYVNLFACGFGRLIAVAVSGV